jgi:hypothetical protein
MKGITMIPKIVNTSVKDFIAVDNDIKHSLSIAGQALMRMRDERLYLAGDYKTFDAYLKDLCMSPRTAYREIERFVTMTQLANIGTNLTLSKSQLDSLSNIAPEHRRITIDAALAVTASLQDTLTATRIERVGQVIDEITTTGSVDIGDGESHPIVDNPIHAAVMKNELEAIARQAEHQRSRNNRKYHERNVEAKVWGRTLRLSEQIKMDDGAVVHVSFWTEAIEEESE